MVRLKGLEPSRPKTPDPKSGASTNSATSALVAAKIVKNGETGKIILDFYDTRRLMRMRKLHTFYFFSSSMNRFISASCAFAFRKRCHWLRARVRLWSAYWHFQ